MNRLRQIIFIILGHFLPFNPPTNQVNQNFEKWKKKKGLRGVIILHMCTKNQDMMYGSWDVEHGQIDFFVILNYFLSFYPPNKLKNQNFEKMKKKEKTQGGYHHFTHVYNNENHMMYGSWDMKHNRHNFLSFWTMFFSFTQLTTQKIKILKKKIKNVSRYHHFRQVYQKS